LVNTTSDPPLTVSFGLDYQVPDLQALTKPDDAPSEPPPQVAEGRATEAGVGDAEVGDFQLPLDLESPVPAWVEAWHAPRLNVAIAAVFLTALPLIFVFQAQLTRSRLAHRLVRNGFLLVVLVWLGWTAGVQLSIVNVINYLMAPFNRFDIG